MYKVFRADKDTYVTDRVIKSIRSTGANTGIAGSLDLFKLYGSTFTGSSPNVELSRLLLHFDLTSLTDMVTAGTIDYSNSTFFAKLQLSDVYGGQATPDNFTVTVSPLSKSFSEGHGKDVVYYSDYDAANFITASSGNYWILSGCNSPGATGSSCDYFTGSVATSQYFTTGEENLNVDVTTAIRAILTGTIPNSGFRIALTPEEETDVRTYFVKRFASRHAYNEEKRPKLVVGFDDSIRDSSQGMTLDSNQTLFLYNYDHGVPTNLSVTGLNCIALKMRMPISGGFYEVAVTGSQHYSGINPVTGVYSASIYLSSSNANVVSALQSSGSIIKFTPIWGTLNGTTAFFTGSQIPVIAATRGSKFLSPTKFVVTATNVSNEFRIDETPVIRVNIFDHTSPFVTVVKTPVESPGSLQGIASDAFYRVRDVATDYVAIPFDTTKGSTRLSSDSAGLYFKLDVANLDVNRSYVIDVLLIVGGVSQHYSAVSPVFKVLAEL